MLDLLGEPHTEYAFERAPFAPGGYGAQAARGDLVFYTWFEARPIAPQTIPVECGVGYDAAPWGCRRIYESEAWRHYMWGRYGSTLEDRKQSAVIPWAFDPDEWPLGAGAGGYVSYLGRLMPDKGIKQLLRAAAELPGLEFRVASTNAWCHPDAPKNVAFVGPVIGRARAKFLGDAVVHLCPTEYIEPLNGSAIEAMLCGTPVVASDWGGFTETIVEWVSGVRAANEQELHTLITFTAAAWDRSACREVTAAGFSIEQAATRWHRFLTNVRFIGSAAPRPSRAS